jgi:GTP-binding protein Era
MSTHCGYIAIIGRPNVGKSTLLNSLLPKKISITSRKPQTTRHKILGIKTLDETQLIFVDTPGIHKEDKRLLNHYLNRAALQVLKEVDCILWLIDAVRWNDDDDFVAEKLQKINVPVILVINKVDKLANNDAVIPLVEELAQKLPTTEIIPISAKKKFNLDHLLDMVNRTLPAGPFFFAKEQLTDRNDAFIAAEMVREKLIRTLGDELPYATMVAVDAMQQKKDIIHISAIIWVEKEGQKGIVIGKQGEMLKRIGRAARLALEKYFDKKVFLQVWVKVKTSWSEDERILKQVLQ